MSNLTDSDRAKEVAESIYSPEIGALSRTIHLELKRQRRVIADDVMELWGRKDNPRGFDEAVLEIYNFILGK